jgi:hypothetical protein
VRLRPARPECERTVRRAITLTPSRGAEVIVEARVPAPELQAVA